MEKKYTPKERREIYLKAAQLIGTERTFCSLIISYGCTALKYASDSRAHDRDELPGLFPEFFLFDPNTKELGWWDVLDNQPRIFALLLCAEMTKGATE